MKKLLLLLLFFTAPAYAESIVINDKTTATLMAEVNTVKPGEPFMVGVLLSPRQIGWHSYWQNPGDAGIATNFTWNLPEGTQIGEIKWPAPVRMKENTLAVYGYEGEVLLPVELTLPEGYSGEKFPIAVKADWLICKEICVPESAELSLELPVLDMAMPSDNKERFAQAKEAEPVVLVEDIPFHTTQDSIALLLPKTLDVKASDEVYFFPREENQILYPAEQSLKVAEVTSLTMARSANDTMPQTLSGVLKVNDKAYEVRAALSKAPAPPVTKPVLGLGWLLLSALFGGLILNLMPCVLPVLSLKALAIAKKAAHDKKVVVRQALAYTAGILLSFAAIAVLLIGLQQSGEAIGWGFQMQSPVFVGFLACLLFLIGLNLSGMYELPVLFGSALKDTPQHSLRGSFFTGVLATLVATPCTAPFMATAVGAALSLPPINALLIFLFLGLGLALPFLLIAVCPRCLRYLPKPGAWMIVFKQFLAFPIYASVVWLLWVLALQSGANGLLIVLSTMVTLAFMVWMKSYVRDCSRLCKVATLLTLLAVLASGLLALAKMPEQRENAPFSQAALDALLAEKKPVLVDATAAWCITCQVNKKIAIDTPATQAALRDTGTVFMVADWTRRNPEITKFLKSFGYNGVPLVVYYPVNGEPVVLPQVLSEALVIKTIKP